ncbi:MAG: LPS export ABC transporter periplasmic protein LptC, partial [Candidatus Poribacteria bacterium]|nr:LPS export ABC transporter periplasmic protein LptC [Candidatus Poribacteria bacterium]
MNTTKPKSKQSRREHRFPLRKFCNFCVYAGFLMLFVSLGSLTLGAEETETAERPSTDTAEIQTAQDTVEQEGSAEDTDATPEPTKEIITGTSKRMESYEQEGITILIDEAKTVRRNEQGIEIGFLNADKITLKRDVETGTTKEIVAEGNVEIRDQEIFATCDHAIMNNLTSTIILQDNVVVLQNKDRLETKYFTFNRVTGKQTAEGDVKFKVTVTQA